MLNQNCFFCGRISESELIPNSSSTMYSCPSCGRYSITDELVFDLRQYNHEDKMKISHLLAEHRLKKITPFFLTSAFEGSVPHFVVKKVKEILLTYPQDALEILDRTLLNLSRLVHHPSDHIPVSENIKELFFSKDATGIFYIIRQLHNMDFITNAGTMPHDINIEAKGWLKIGELKSKPEGQAKQAFVAMWFDKSMDNIFENGIRKAIQDAIGYKVMRVDMVEHNNKICDQIIAEIKRSSFVVADFTGNRGGVYFEAGYAQGLGLPVIWIANENDIKALHFDTRQYNHIVYKNEAELYNKLKARIEATINKSA
jgi:nucleoside 2-deoxyribosyltransferase